MLILNINVYVFRDGKNVPGRNGGHNELSPIKLSKATIAVFTLKWSNPFTQTFRLPCI